MTLKFFFSPLQFQITEVLLYCTLLSLEKYIFLSDNCETIIKIESDIDDNLDGFVDDGDGNAVLKHPGQLCRLCASSTKDVIYIFSSAGRQLNIADKINSSLPVLVCM
jgi:hypothetical protein